MSWLASWPGPRSRAYPIEPGRRVLLPIGPADRHLEPFAAGEGGARTRIVRLPTWMVPRGSRRNARYQLPLRYCPGPHEHPPFHDHGPDGDESVVFAAGPQADNVDLVDRGQNSLTESGRLEHGYPCGCRVTDRSPTPGTPRNRRPRCRRTRNSRASDSLVDRASFPRTAKISSSNSTSSASCDRDRSSRSASTRRSRSSRVAAESHSRWQPPPSAAGEPPCRASGPARRGMPSPLSAARCESSCRSGFRRPIHLHRACRWRSCRRCAASRCWLPGGPALGRARRQPNGPRGRFGRARPPAAGGVAGVMTGMRRHAPCRERAHQPYIANGGQANEIRLWRRELLPRLKSGDGSADGARQTPASFARKMLLVTRYRRQSRPGSWISR